MSLTNVTPVNLIIKKGVEEERRGWVGHIGVEVSRRKHRGENGSLTGSSSWPHYLIREANVATNSSQLFSNR